MMAKAGGNAGFRLRQLNSGDQSHQDLPTTTRKINAMPLSSWPLSRTAPSRNGIRNMMATVNVNGNVRNGKRGDSKGNVNVNGNLTGKLNESQITA